MKVTAVVNAQGAEADGRFTRAEPQALYTPFSIRKS
jgi:hypothetical protein